MPILLIVFLCASLSTLWGKPLKVEVGAPSALLMNAKTGAILYAKQIHQRHYPASITKIATALYALEKKGQKLDQMVQASSHALTTLPAHVRQAADSKHPPYRLEVGGSTIGIRQGEALSLHTLLYGLLLASGNDAANVLAESVSGSIDEFMVELNSFLKARGIQETHFTNPHGLHHPDHWTTAYDMAQIARLALQHSTFREVVKTTHYPRPQTNKQKPTYLVQTNRLIKAGPYFYSKAIGIKTGYTSQAGHTLVGAASHEGRDLILVFLNCADSHQRFRDAIKLFDAAFAEKPVSRVLFAKEADHFTYKMKGAVRTVDAVLKHDLVLSYYPAEEPAFKAEIRWLMPALPIQVGDAVGVLRLIAEGGEILQELPLLATSKVEKQWWVYVGDGCHAHKRLLIGLFLTAQVGLLLFYFLKKSQKVGQG